MDTSSVFYSHLNARDLAPDEVARGFVANADFQQLWQCDNALLMGPRGCGKTTLLKMLTPKALHAWQTEEGKAISAAIRYTGIYIPTDIHWKQQLDNSDRLLEALPKFKLVFSRAAVTTNVLKALCAGMRDRLCYEIHLPNLESLEEELCKTLIEVWLLPATILQLTSVEAELSKRINELRTVRNRVASRAASDSLVPTLPEFWYLDYMAAAAAACEAFDTLFCRDKAKRWALCFDELELAPDWLQTKLIGQLRSTDQRFLFKLGTSPFPIVKSRTQSRSKADCTIIVLWHHAGQDKRRFCAKLTESILRRRSLQSVTPKKLLGESPHVKFRQIKIPESPNRELRRIIALISREAIKGKQLQSELKKYGLNTKALQWPFNEMQKRFLRKIAPLLIHRDAFQSKHIVKGGLPVIVNSNPYYGEDALYDISDGNPRWLLGMLNDLIRAMPKRGRSMVPAHTQSQIFRAASTAFHTMLETLPVIGPEGVPFEGLHVVDIVDSVGQYFRNTTVKGEFELSPPGCFKIDANVPTDVRTVLPSGTYEGAFICSDLGIHDFYPKPDNKTFRLTYMLAPYFGIPLTAQHAVPVSSLMSSPAARLPVSK